MMPIVQLRDIAESDLVIFFKHQLEPEAAQIAAFAPRDEATFYSRWNAGGATTVRRTILVDGRVAGYVGSFLRAEMREVCYWLG